MRDEAVEEVVRILPDALGDDERRGGVEVGKHRHAFLLGADETVLHISFVGMGADEFVTERGDDLGELFFHGGLGGPALLVGGLAQIAVGDEVDGFFREFFHGGRKVLGETRCSRFV